MAKIGYIRVSSPDQNIERQVDALQALNLDRVFSDKASGRSTDRPGLQSMLSFLREGDTLYVESISRIARSTKDLLDIVEELQSKRVGFVSLKESIDTTTAQDRFVLTLFGALSELERATIRQRQREGIDAAKSRGRKLGRPAAEYPTGWESAFSRWMSGDETATATMKALGLRRTTFYKLAKSWSTRRAKMAS